MYRDIVAFLGPFQTQCADERGLQAEINVLVAEGVIAENYVDRALKGTH